MNKEKIDRIVEIKENIKKLPKGYISTKTIKGNTYFYLQWSENGKRYSKLLSIDELQKILPLIEERQKLEEELKLLKKGIIQSDVLKCKLMHLNEPVVDLYIDFDTGIIKEIGKVYSIKHLPIGTVTKEEIDKKAFFEWWNERSIPLSRSGIKDALEKLNISNPQALLLKCYALSLSDQYWIKPRGEDIFWEDINYFDNDFKDDVGEILFGYNINNKTLDLSSPNNTSVGNLKKKWRIINNKRVLIKGGSNPYRQEPFNEVLACYVAKKLDIPCVEYTLYFDEGYPYSICEDFINKEEDLVTAHQILKVLKKNNSDSTYTHLLKCLKKLGIKNIQEFFDKLLVFDFIIANEDRHLNNFGFIRNAKTLEFEGAAPLFDNGASFGFDKITIDIEPFKNISSKPFHDNPIKQLDLVSNFDWLDINKLQQLKIDIKNIIKNYESKYLDDKRIEAISNAVNARIDFIISKIK